MRNKLGLFCSQTTDVLWARAEKFLCELANVPHYDDSPDGPNATSDERGIHVRPPAAVEDAWRRIYHLYPDLLPMHGNPDHERPSRAPTDAPGFAWEDPDDLGYVSVGDIPPKLRVAWTMPGVQSRKIFLISELAYYLRGPAMMEAAKKARQAEMEVREQAEREGAKPEGAFGSGYEVWAEVLRKERQNLQKIWRASDADGFAQVLLRAFEIADRMRRCPNPDCPAPYFIAQRRSQKYCSDACALPAQREFKRDWWREHGSSWRRKGKSRVATNRRPSRVV